MIFAVLGLVLACVVGGALCAAGIRGVRRSRHRAGTAQRATGVVVGQRSSWSSSAQSDMLVHPVVRYRTADGREVTFQASVGSAPPVHTVGQRVTVLYDPAAPERATIQSPVNWVVDAGFIGCGGGLLGLGLLGLLVLLWVQAR